MATADYLKKIGKQVGLKQLNEELKKSSSDYSPLIFLIAFMAASTSDGLDMIPVPLLDILMGLPCEAIVAFILISQLGWKRNVYKRALQIMAGLFLDDALAQIPGVEFVTPITTIMVLIAWHQTSKDADEYAKKARKVKRQMESLQNS